MEFQERVVNPLQAEEQVDREERLNRLREERRAMKDELIERHRKQIEKHQLKMRLFMPELRIPRVKVHMAPPPAAGQPGVN